ncbi:DUF4134 domain-containing protein [Filimonas effusa]|uniref:DUF4134 domain-containing protein n=2 Tax=Filimonas effusa TaxID=2508721 RepID=A0A4Q1DE74_9BACT|nr:DUF4134 domain-containing protein [Filimonas effusa]RXK86993.1 DUF4134 domain-containing protein [Filimonas effusa]
MKMCVWNCFRKSGRRMLRASMLTMAAVVITNFSSYAQDGIAGIEEANSKVRGYFDIGCDLMYAVGAILGLIGAVRVYQKWSNGAPETGSVAAAWFGSCVFLVIVATVLKSFFGI